MEAAKEALNNVRQQDIGEIKALPQPPEVIQKVCTMCYYMYPKAVPDDAWASVKLKLISDMDLLKNLKEYQVDKLKAEGANKAKKALANLEKDAGCTGAELYAYVKNKSLAAAGLYSWVASTIKCFDIFRDVEPKRKNAEKLKVLKAAAEKDLAETESRLKDVTEKLSDLNSKRTIKQKELDELERISKDMTRKLTAASKLITGLGSE